MLLLGLLGAGPATAPVVPKIDPADLKLPPALEPAEALKTFRVKPGYRIEIAAAEPQTMDPIAMCFDERGRMFVVEMRDYSERRQEQLGRISMLEDADGDGRFEKSTIVAEDLPWPTGLIWAGGGLYVLASPDLLFLKDSDADGRFDHREVVFTGFGEGVSKLNVQALPNSLTWGIDNRIHGATAANGAKLRAPGAAGKPLELRGRDFSFDPRQRDLRPEAGGGQYGLSFDTQGRKYVCSNSHHIQFMAYEARYAGLNPHRGLPSPLLDIAPDGPAAEVFRTSPDEGWRVIRTRWRVTGVVPGIIEGGGRASGYFTSATGIVIYTGDAMPELAGHAFVADCGSNLVHHKVISRPDGATIPIALRAEDEKRTEFLTSTDNWFRPVALANGPDGALYVIDMYRQIIEHPWSLPPEIKQHLDLNAGNDRGRIFRIVPEKFARPGRVDLAKATTNELVTALSARNGWMSDTARRLLYERKDPGAAAKIEELLRGNGYGRWNALWALDGLGALSEAHVLKAMSDEDPAVRRAGVLLAERFLGPAGSSTPPADALWMALRGRAGDGDASVRYQLAWTLGLVKHAEQPDALAALIETAPEDTWLAEAVLNSTRRPSAVLAGIGASKALAQRQGGPPAGLLRGLAGMIGAGNDPAEVAAAVELVRKTTDPALAMPLALALSEGLASSGSSAAKAGLDIGALHDEARRLLGDGAAPVPARVRAAEFMKLASFADASAVLLPLLDHRQPQELQLAALWTLDRFANSELAPQLVKRATALSPRLRSEAIAVLLKRPDRAAVLLRAVESGKVRVSELASTQRDLLMSHADASLGELARRLFSASQSGSRQDVVKQFTPVLSVAGDGLKGRAIFSERCASCHRHGGMGSALGPDLVTVQTSGGDALLNAILDPNRDVAPQFLAYVLETRDGETLVGLVTLETSAAITLRQANGVETVVPRNRVKRLRSSAQSLMPEGLEQDLKPQDIADLLAFITRPPEK